MPKRKKKRKFVRPPTGLRSKGPGSNPHSVVHYHKDFVYDQLRYTVLTISQMSKADRNLVEATLKTIITGPQAMTLPDGTNGWACVEVGQSKRVYLVSYHGIEVALFLKRQETMVVLQPGDRFPEGVMQGPVDAWQRLDVLGQSAKKSNFVLSTLHQRLENENKLMRSRLQVFEQLNDQLEREIKALKVEQSKNREKLKTLLRPQRPGKSCRTKSRARKSTR